jgi:DNA-binding protein Fis
VREESVLIATKRKGGAGESTEGREVFDLFVDYLCREQPILLKDLMDRIEKDIIVRSLRMAEGNQKQAAGILGVKYTTLHEKLKKFGIRFPKAPVPFAF